MQAPCIGYAILHGSTTAFFDSRLTGLCAYCGLLPNTRDHVPSRVLLDEPFPPQLPVVDACGACNNQFSLDEQYVACFVEVVLSGTINFSAIGRAKVKRILEENAALASRIRVSQRTDGEGNLFWEPEIDRVRRVALKLARGHAAYELYPQLAEPDQVKVAPIILMSDEAIDEFERLNSGGVSGWPEVGSRAFLRTCGKSSDRMGRSDDWVVVQPGCYRYAVSEEPFRVRIVLSEYLACQVVWS